MIVLNSQKHSITKIMFHIYKSEGQNLQIEYMYLYVFFYTSHMSHEKKNVGRGINVLFIDGKVVTVTYSECG
jgi:hypothetical protein